MNTLFESFTLLETGENNIKYLNTSLLIPFVLLGRNSDEMQKGKYQFKRNVVHRMLHYLFKVVFFICARNNTQELVQSAWWASDRLSRKPVA